MRLRSALILLIVTAIVGFPYPTGCAEGDYPVLTAETVEDPVTALGPYRLLDSNGTENLTALLMADIEPPYYGNEPVGLVMAWLVSPDILEPNETAEVLLGLDDLAPPDEVLEVRYNYSGPPPSPPCCQGPLASAFASVVPSEVSSAFVGMVSYANETVNLTFDLEVMPARIILDTDMGIPMHNRSWYELAWVEVPIVVSNSGGAAAIDLVVDVRYGDRIVHTEDVAVVPAFGNHTFSMPFKPLHGYENMEVFLVSGVDGPRSIGHIHLRVDRRPLLQVVDVGVPRPSVKEGKEVVVTVAVVNGGNATSSGDVVELIVDGTVVANESLFLGPGEMTNITFVWRPKGPGVHAVSARMEGDELGTGSASLRVEKEEAPGMDPPLLAGAIVLAATLTMAVWRSSRARRA